MIGASPDDFLQRGTSVGSEGEREREEYNWNRGNRLPSSEPSISELVVVSTIGLSVPETDVTGTIRIVFARCFCARGALIRRVS